MASYLKTLLPCILLFIILPLAAQKRGYERGHIITLEGDTIPGQVKDRSPEPFVDLYSRIRFRPQGKSARKKYGPEDILGYRAGNREYVSMPFREESAFFRFRYVVDPGAEKSFLQVIRRQGPLTWYHLEFTYDDNFTVDFIPLLHKEGDSEMVRVTQGILGLKRDRLADYFQECPELARAITDKQLNGVAEVYEFYLDHCAVGWAAKPEKGSLEGAWILEPGQAPDAPSYLQNFRVDRISGNGFEGKFYGSRIEEARLNRYQDRLYFAFTTQGQAQHAFYHSGYLEDGLLHGVTYCPDLKSVSPWTGTRK